MRYLIRTVPLREWYVKDLLIPEMIRQGINEESICVYCDNDYKGNLDSCIEAFTVAKHFDMGLWYLQDDVILSDDFAKRTKELMYEHEIVCGFCSSYDKKNVSNTGETDNKDNMWYSFPCIYIDNTLTSAFLDWIENDAPDIEIYNNLIDSGKHDDSLFRAFITHIPFKVDIFNAVPNLVDHIDMFIGGSITNPQRGCGEDAVSQFFDANRRTQELHRLREYLCTHKL